MPPAIPCDALMIANVQLKIQAWTTQFPAGQHEMTGAEASQLVDSLVDDSGNMRLSVESHVPDFIDKASLNIRSLLKEAMNEGNKFLQIQVLLTSMKEINLSLTIGLQQHQMEHQVALSGRHQ